LPTNPDLTLVLNQFFSSLNHATTDGQLHGTLARAANSLGFPYFLYYGSVYDNFRQSTNTLISNYPEAYFNVNREPLLFNQHPSFVKSKLTGESVVWSKGLFNKQTSFKQAIAAAGLVSGWGALAMHRPNRLGFLEFARNKGAITPDELASKQHLMHAIADGLERRRSDLAMLNQTQTANETFAASPMQCQLTLRELEILRWTADGKTADEIGFILNISPRTISYHLASIMSILDVPNKTAAVSRAQMQCWLY
jgi:LuxR family transcriptional regulator